MARYVFKDTETTGADTRYDQILQFAAIMTDDALNELDVIDVRCRRLPHVLPNPVALAVTNIDPWTLKENKMSFFEMARYVHEKYKLWAPATFIGHNTLGFDEEIERSMFWMNLLDPYVTNTKGSARADTLIMLRAAHALRPGLLKIRTHEEKGSPIFKLEIIAPDNGFDGHAAHDALGDIRANIFIAKIVKEKAPDIWASLMRNSNPGDVEELIAQPLVLMMTHFGNAEFFPAVRIAMNPSNKRQALMLDLSKDFGPWLDKSVQEIADGIFTKESPFQTLKTNAMPTVFSPTDPVAADKWAEVAAAAGDLQQKRFDVMAHPTFVENCIAALKVKAESFKNSANVEEQIYGGNFVSWPDKDRMKAFHQHPDWQERLSTASSFRTSDERLFKISHRIFWSEAPELLNKEIVNATDARVVQERILGAAKQADGEETRWCTLEKAREDLGHEKVKDHPLFEKIVTWYDALEQAVKADPSAIRTFG
jgi:exodeoxyribonuclease-1